MWIENCKRNCAERGLCSGSEGPAPGEALLLMRSLAFSLSKMPVKCECERRWGRGSEGAVGVLGVQGLQPLLSLDNSIWNNFIVFTFDFYKNAGSGSRGSRGGVMCGMYSGHLQCSQSARRTTTHKFNTATATTSERTNERTTKSLGNVYISSCWQGVKGGGG